MFVTLFYGTGMQVGESYNATGTIQPRPTVNDGCEVR